MCADQGALDTEECTLLLVFLSAICCCFVGSTLGVDCCLMLDSDNMYRNFHLLQRIAFVVKRLNLYNPWLSSAELLSYQIIIPASDKPRTDIPTSKRILASDKELVKARNIHDDVAAQSRRLCDHSELRNVGVKQIDFV